MNPIAERKDGGKLGEMVKTSERTRSGFILSAAKLRARTLSYLLKQADRKLIDCVRKFYRSLGPGLSKVTTILCSHRARYYP